MDVDQPLMKEWIVRLDQKASAYTALIATNYSVSQTRSIMSKTNAFLKKKKNSIGGGAALG